MKQLQNNASFGLYVHVPFCTVRCGYCDFNTYTPSELEQVDAIDLWTQALISEITYSLEKLPENQAVETIFFGGGTPSLLPLNNLEQIFSKLNDSFIFSENIEITLEANPDTLTSSKIQAWKDFGINRISLGVQSADKKILQILDRTHNPENVKNSVELLKNGGIHNFSLDLIYGTPGETLDSWSSTVESLVDFDPPHVSAYALTVEPRTALFRKVNNKEIGDISSDDQADKYLIANDILEKNNLAWYEISNWAKHGYECRQNLLYWNNQNWWGYGPGAHSHIDGKRWWNVKHPANYAKKLVNEKSAIADFENLSFDQKNLEQTMLLMRLRESDLRELAPTSVLSEWENLDYVSRGSNNLELTPKGRLLLDSLIAQITP
ncbi:MAG: radical SAM family heme chaperone HemW [Candidatus Nanopelagicales bacterium]